MAAAELIDRARAGDALAFASLVDPYRRELHVHCYRILGSVQDAEDALQETLLAAWRDLDGFEGRSSFRTWLYRLATNRCLNALRSARRRPQTDWPPPGIHPPAATRLGEVTWLEPYPDVLLEELTDRAPGPEARYEAREAISLAFVTAVQLLPARQRAALILRDVLGFAAREVAGMLDASEESVTSALKRARAALARGLPSPPGRAAEVVIDGSRRSLSTASSARGPGVEGGQLRDRAGKPVADSPVGGDPGKLIASLGVGDAAGSDERLDERLTDDQAHDRRRDRPDSLALHRVGDEIDELTEAQRRVVDEVVFTAGGCPFQRRAVAVGEVVDVHATPVAMAVADAPQSATSGLIPECALEQATRSVHEPGSDHHKIEATRCVSSQRLNFGGVPDAERRRLKRRLGGDPVIAAVPVVEVSAGVHQALARGGAGRCESNGHDVVGVLDLPHFRCGHATRWCALSGVDHGVDVVDGVAVGLGLQHVAGQQPSAMIGECSGAFRRADQGGHVVAACEQSPDHRSANEPGCAGNEHVGGSQRRGGRVTGRLGNWWQESSSWSLFRLKPPARLRRERAEAGSVSAIRRSGRV
jgi:RNA polymerase sigma factor (sigma-70 family)